MPTRIEKVDNASLMSKVELRRWLLGRMGITEAYVLDTCAGLGRVWAAMEDHVAIRQWTRCDIKPRRPGTLGIAAVDAVTSFPLASYNVIDIDTYGEPWEPFHLALERLSRPTAIFLTHGHVLKSVVSKANLARAGAAPEWWPHMPRTPQVSIFVAERLLSAAWDSVDILHSAKVVQSHLVSYYALACSPKQPIQA